MAIFRLNELPEGSGSLSNDDIFLFMDDPSGNSITKKISLDQIATAIGGVDFGSYFNTTISTGSGINFEYSSGNNNLTINSSGIVSNTLVVSGSDRITNIISLSQAEYDAIAIKDPTTLYFIV